MPVFRTVLCAVASAGDAAAAVLAWPSQRSPAALIKVVVEGATNEAAKQRARLSMMVPGSCSRDRRSEEHAQAKA